MPINYVGTAKSKRVDVIQDRVCIGYIERLSYRVPNRNNERRDTWQASIRPVGQAVYQRAMADSFGEIKEKITEFLENADDIAVTTNV